jgi:hypothetical protein
MMARRSGELIDLVAGRCLDISERYLVFANRKSGFGGLRETEARPVPKIVVRFIKLMERLQSEMIALGSLEATTNLLSPPRKVGSPGLAVLTPGRYGEALDLFCDWAETPLDSDGKRYYVRQHQLRRFFVLLFFWGGGFGGMDCLRWFLGQTDIQHLWHYITESTPGATLRSIAAEHVAYGIRHATDEAETLAAELAEHFNTTDFSVLDEEALVMHLEDLMEEGRLTVEPQFVDGGTAYRIAVILRPKG